MGERTRRTLVLDPQGDDLSGLFSSLLARGHLVATRRNAFDCLSYVLEHRPSLVLILATRMPGESERIAATVQRLVPGTRVLVLAQEEKGKLERRVERLVVEESWKVLTHGGA